MEKKNRITIQFNQEKKAVNERQSWTPPVHKREESVSFEPEVVDFFRRDEESVSERDKKEEPAQLGVKSFTFGKEKSSLFEEEDNEQSFHTGEPSWNWNKPIEVYDYEEGTKSRRKKYQLSNNFKKGSKIALNIGTAIGVGVLLGAMVLSIFSSLEEKTSLTSSQKSSIQQTQQSEAQTVSVDGETPLLIPTGSVENGLIQLPAKSYFVVQAGAFSDLTAAKDVLQKHQQAGYSGILLEDAEPYRFFIGIGSTKEEASKIAAVYKEQGMETYVREHIVAEVSDGKLAADPESLTKLPTFLNKSDQLVAKLNQVVSKGMGDPTYKLSAEEWKKLQNLHQSILKEGKLFSTWQGEEKKVGEQMVHHLTKGVTTLETFKNQNHLAYLWQTQQATLDYMKEYEKFVSTIK